MNSCLPSIHLVGVFHHRAQCVIAGVPVSQPCAVVWQDGRVSHGLTVSAWSGQSITAAGWLAAWYLAQYQLDQRKCENHIVLEICGGSNVIQIQIYWHHHPCWHTTHHAPVNKLVIRIVSQWFIETSHSASYSIILRESPWSETTGLWVGIMSEGWHVNRFPENGQSVMHWSLLTMMKWWQCQECILVKSNVYCDSLENNYQWQLSGCCLAPSWQDIGREHCHG